MDQKVKSENTKKLIIDTSFDIFYKKGYHNTSIPDIMKKTKLTKGAFYHHFNNKIDIGIKVIENILTKRIQEGFIKPLLENKTRKTPELLHYVFSERIKGFSQKEKAQGCPANNLINEIGCNSHDFRKPLQKLIDNWHNVLTKTIQRGIDQNEISKKTNAASASTMLICSFEGTRGIRKIYDDDELFKSYLRAVKSYIKSISI